jgi:hypothetical protein
MWEELERQKNVYPPNHPQLALIQLVETALRAAWGQDTCNAKDGESWTPENAAFGQCVLSMLIISAFLSEGEALKDDHNDHYWWRDQYGDIDLTREQFPQGIAIGATRARDRHELLVGPRAEAARTKDRLMILSGRVIEALAQLGMDQASLEKFAQAIASF